MENVVEGVSVKATNKHHFPDILVEGTPYGNIIVEMKGNYWHANPYMYDKDDLIKGRPAKEIWAADEKRKRELEQLGYMVLEVWEEDFKHYGKSHKVISKLDGMLNWDTCNF